MNNLRYYEDSIAYDFNMFAPAKKINTAKKAKIIDIPNEQKKRANRRKKAATGVSGKVSAIVVTVFILAMLGGNVLLRAQITETEQQIAKVEEQINVAESKLDAVNFQMGQKLSYSNLEQRATALGMRKMDKSQIVYIRTNQENKAVLGEGQLSAENN